MEKFGNYSDPQRAKEVLLDYQRAFSGLVDLEVINAIANSYSRSRDLDARLGYLLMKVSISGENHKLPYDFNIINDDLDGFGGYGRDIRFLEDGNLNQRF
jgi:hypothetical protein